jgi:hypothetical protein
MDEREMRSAGILARAQEFMWRNGRLLERCLFAHLFGEGPRKPVLVALRAYQNEDGGFGNALEPDKRCPHSQPVDVETALHVLDHMDGLDDPMVERACDWLVTVTTGEGGVPFALPSVRDYPRAPWWEAEDDPPASLNPTAAIAGLLLKHDVQHPWLEGARDYCWGAIEGLETDEFHTLMPVVTFLEHAPDRERAERELERIGARIAWVVERDPFATGYVKKPLDWAPTPDSFCRRLFDDELIAAHLAALAGRQQPDGGWPISWEPISRMVELEWRGMFTVDALRTLRAYGELV